MRNRRWQNKEVSLVKKLYPDAPNFCIGSLLGRNKNQIDHMGKRLKLKKSREYWTSLATEQFKSKSTPFKKGQVSLRKGVKISEDQKAKMTSMFKKGNTPWHAKYPKELILTHLALGKLKKHIDEHDKRTEN